MKSALIFLLPTLLLQAALLILAPELRAAVLRASHDLEVSLDPAAQQLRGKDTMRLTLRHARGIDFRLNEEAEVNEVFLQGRKAAFERRAGWVLVDIPQDDREQWFDGEALLEVTYTARFDDPLPDDPANFDNPGFGVRGYIGPEGALLLAGSGWHPKMAAEVKSFRVRVTAPRGMSAVTVGRLLALEDDADKSVSLWEVRGHVEDLPLAAGRYVVGRKELLLAGGDGEGEERAVEAQTFFLASNQELSSRYLKAAARHVTFYSDLHGPYAFDKFAVVENFFPTGYGFPSFTLLGGRVLRLPFIPETSLRHEVAHCWWGNGVLVNYGQGNWCEGLTTYVADYLAEEEKSDKAAREYRLRVLRDYALLVGDGPAMPLRKFISRDSPSSRVLGYGKAMYVFHMLRKMMGDGHFWNGLRELYAARLFQRTSWSDILDVFLREGGLDASAAGCFFEQWIEWAEAPRLWLENVSLKQDATGWRVRGHIRQDTPAFCMYLPLELETPEGPLNETLILHRDSREFTLLSRARPTALQVDPEADIFRLLEPGEIPATVNSVKGSTSLKAVLAAGQPPQRAAVLQRLLRGLNQGRVTLLREEQLDAEAVSALKGHDLLFFGYPETPALRLLLPSPPEGVRLRDGGVELEFAPETRRADTLFVTMTRSVDEAGSVVALLLPREQASNEALETAVRKITHYGSYGCLAFDKGENLLKWRWPPASSPLRVEFSKDFGSSENDDS